MIIELIYFPNEYCLTQENCNFPTYILYIDLENKHNKFLVTL